MTINPFLNKPTPPAWNDLGEYQQVLQRIAKTPNLLQLVRAFELRAYQYIFLLQYGLITTDGTNLTLTDVSEGYLNRYCTQRFEGGDLVTIIQLERTKLSRGHWFGQTDDEYRISLYGEDFHAIEHAGYTIPDWHDLGAFKVSIPVIVSKEIQASGWRIASVVRAKS